jgi:hypothetical protein
LAFRELRTFTDDHARLATIADTPGCESNCAKSFTFSKSGK